MKTTVENINTVQKRVNIEITVEDVNKEFKKALQSLRGKAKISGFRPGKAPLNIIKKLYGANVAGDVGEKLIQGTLFKALTDEDITPIAQPVIDVEKAPAEDEAFTFTAVVDILPQLEFSDYKNLNLDVDKFEVSDDLMQKELRAMQRRSIVTKPILEGELIAAAGHLATINQKALLEGNEVPQFTAEKFDVALGEGELFEGLEKAILGMRQGEEKEVDIELPKDYGDESLAGKTLHFHLKIEELKKFELPEINDEFAKDMQCETAEEFKSKVKENLQSQCDRQNRQLKETAILNEIVEKYEFEVPPAMVDQVIDSMINEMPHQQPEQRQQALKDEELRGHLKDAAKRRTKNTLILWHVSKTENIEVTDEDVNKKVDETLAMYGLSGHEQAAQLRSTFEKNIRENYIFEKSMDFLIESTNFKENVKNFD